MNLTGMSSKNKLLSSIRRLAGESASALRKKGFKERDVIRMAVRGRGQ